MADRWNRRRRLASLVGWSIWFWFASRVACAITLDFASLDSDTRDRYLEVILRCGDPPRDLVVFAAFAGVVSFVRAARGRLANVLACLTVMAPLMRFALFCAANLPRRFAQSSRYFGVAHPDAQAYILSVFSEQQSFAELGVTHWVFVTFVTAALAVGRGGGSFRETARSLLPVQIATTLALVAWLVGTRAHVLTVTEAGLWLDAVAPFVLGASGAVVIAAIICGAGIARRPREVGNFLPSTVPVILILSVAFASVVIPWALRPRYRAPWWAVRGFTPAAIEAEPWEDRTALFLPPASMVRFASLKGVRVVDRNGATSSVELSDSGQFDTEGSAPIDALALDGRASGPVLRTALRSARAPSGVVRLLGMPIREGDSPSSLHGTAAWLFPALLEVNTWLPSLTVLIADDNALHCLYDADVAYITNVGAAPAERALGPTADDDLLFTTRTHFSNEAFDRELRAIGPCGARNPYFVGVRDDATLASLLETLRRMKRAGLVEPLIFARPLPERIAAHLRAAEAVHR